MDITKVSRAQRNLNPGNLRPLARNQKWVGQICIDTFPGGPFVKFQTAGLGFRALMILLRNYYRAHDRNTIEKIINRFAPPEENHVSSYIKAVERNSGISSKAVINVTAPNIMIALVVAIARHEAGHIWWQNSDILSGAIAAGLGEKADIEPYL